MRSMIILVSCLWALSPPGAASGAAANWPYAALGASLATGAYGNPGYVYRYQAGIQSATGSTVPLTNLGVGGWTSTQLLEFLNAVTPSDAASYSVITWDIGGNDFLQARDQYKAMTCGGSDNQDCMRGMVAALKSNWSAIVARVLVLKPVGGTIIRTTNLYNPFVHVDGEVNTWPDHMEISPTRGNDLQVLKPYFDDASGYMCATAAANGIPCADVYAAFNGPNGLSDPVAAGYIAWDGIHPNEAGHQKIADLLVALGWGPLL